MNFIGEIYFYEEVDILYDFLGFWNISFLYSPLNSLSITLSHTYTLTCVMKIHILSLSCDDSNFCRPSSMPSSFSTPRACEHIRGRRRFPHLIFFFFLSSPFNSSSSSSARPFLPPVLVLYSATEKNSVTRDIISWTEAFSSVQSPTCLLTLACMLVSRGEKFSPSLFLFRTSAYPSHASPPHAIGRNLFSLVALLLFLSSVSSFCFFSLSQLRVSPLDSPLSLLLMHT